MGFWTRVRLPSSPLWDPHFTRVPRSRYSTVPKIRNTQERRGLCKCLLKRNRPQIGLFFCKTSEVQRGAVANYQEKVDHVNCRFPKGTKQRAVSDVPFMN